MSDEFDRLRKAMNQAAPAPDRAAKAANLRLAQENFEKIQGSPDGARPIPESRSIPGRFISGVTGMLNTLTSRGGLVATTAIVAVGFISLTPQGRSIFSPPNFVEAPAEVQMPKPVAADSGVDPEIVPVAEPEIGALTNVAPSLKRARESAATSLMVESDSSLADMASGELSLIAPAPEEFFRLEQENTESFANEASNPLRVVTQEPVSTFSIDVDTASYGVVRSSLSSGYLPDPASVRVEELVNYFPYDYAGPAADGDPFRPTVSVTQTPWNAETRLVHIALQGEMPALDDRPSLNLVFLIDTSGSMQDANKLPLLKQSFRLMLGQLRPQDQVAIVTYAGSAGQVLAPTAAEDRSTIMAALDQLEAGGSTAGQQGLQQAYSVAEAMSEDGEISRILLATDGDFNVGISDPSALKDFIAKKRDSGTYLSVLGFGRGNLDDATMQALAQNGNGQAAYIDTLNEAQKVLVDQLSGALFPIADDVKIQVEFNPVTVAEYRLIGYETRALRREDFNNDKVDAGEIGAGHSVTALYEVTPVGSSAILNDPLRYQSETVQGDDADELGFLRLRYKEPGASQSQLIETQIMNAIEPANVDVQFSMAVAGFGQLLRGSEFLGDWGWADAIDLATEGRGEDSFGYRAEAINLMRLAASLSQD